MRLKSVGWLKIALLLAALSLYGLGLTANLHAQENRRAAQHDVSLMVRQVASLEFSGPGTLQLPAGGEASGTMLLHYTVTNSAGTKRKLFASWRTGDRAPDGTSLFIQAESVPAGCGQPGAALALSERPSAVIEEIPSCATGRGLSGAILRYWIMVEDQSRLREAVATTVTIVFTLSDDM